VTGAAYFAAGTVLTGTYRRADKNLLLIYGHQLLIPQNLPNASFLQCFFNEATVSNSPGYLSTREFIAWLSFT
jgi:hypothetical protein